MQNRKLNVEKCGFFYEKASERLTQRFKLMLSFLF
jgi:hypothetical protein